MLIVKCCMWSLAYLRVSAVVHPYGWYGPLRDVDSLQAARVLVFVLTGGDPETRSSRVASFTMTVPVRGKEISLSESTQTGCEVHSASNSGGMGGCFLEGKAAGTGSRPSPPTSDTEVKNAWSRTSTSQYISVTCCLIKHRDNFTFTFYQLYEVRRQIFFSLSTFFFFQFRTDQVSATRGSRFRFFWSGGSWVLLRNFDLRTKSGKIKTKKMNKLL